MMKRMVMKRETRIRTMMMTMMRIAMIVSVMTLRVVEKATMMLVANH